MATPLSRLASLSWRWIDEVAHNRAVLLACRADPLAIRGFSPACAVEVLALIGASVDLLEGWSRREDAALRLIAALCPRSPAETLERLTGDEIWHVAWAVGDNPSASPRALALLVERSQREEAQGFRHDRAAELVFHPAWPRLEAQRSRGPDAKVREEAACRPSARRRPR